jgi:hypothetical protein
VDRGASGGRVVLRLPAEILCDRAASAPAAAGRPPAAAA